MNNQTPYYLFKNNKQEFLNKLCAVCLCTLFYPEKSKDEDKNENKDNKFVSCSRLNCQHMFHHNCINQSINTNHLDCPECRAPITKVTNMDKLLEIVIRNEAFDHGYIDANMKRMFETNSVIVEDYPYHKLVFELWSNEKRI